MFCCLGEQQEFIASTELFPWCLPLVFQLFLCINLLILIHGMMCDMRKCPDGIFLLSYSSFLLYLCLPRSPHHPNTFILSSWTSQKMSCWSTRPVSMSWRGLWRSPTASWCTGRSACQERLRAAPQRKRLWVGANGPRGSRECMQEGNHTCDKTASVHLASNFVHYPAYISCSQFWFTYSLHLASIDPVSLAQPYTMQRLLDGMLTVTLVWVLPIICVPSCPEDCTTCVMPWSSSGSVVVRKQYAFLHH